MRKSNIIYLCACFSASLSAAAGAGPVSNEQVVIMATAHNIDSAFTRVMPQEMNIVADSGGMNSLISFGIAEGLRGKYDRITISRAPDTSASNLDFDLLGFAMDYGLGSSRGFLKGRRIRRELRCELRINIRDGKGGALREARSLAITHVDEIERSDIGFVNSRDISELAPQAPESSWSRYAEPSLVVASVGVLVYLFFANR